MTEHDYSIEHLVAERKRLRERVIELEYNGVVVATNIAALQNTAGKPSDDFEGCIE